MCTGSRFINRFPKCSSFLSLCRPGDSTHEVTSHRLLALINSITGHSPSPFAAKQRTHRQRHACAYEDKNFQCYMYLLLLSKLPPVSTKSSHKILTSFEAKEQKIWTEPMILTRPFIHFRNTVFYILTSTHTYLLLQLPQLYINSSSSSLLLLLLTLLLLLRNLVCYYSSCVLKGISVARICWYSDSSEVGWSLCEGRAGGGKKSLFSPCMTKKQEIFPS